MMWLLVTPAVACGGMVCDPGPLESIVVQNAERIAFRVDPEAGMVEAHVQIFYEGPPDAFGWVVPVSAEPEVFVSTDALFDRIATSLAPQIRLEFDTTGDCAGGGGGGGCARASRDGEEDDGGPGDSGLATEADVVQLVSEGQVGPYDFAVLQATSAGVLTAWMTDNSYAIPDGLDAVLQPYIGGDGHFLAVRLSKDRDTGDIAPLGWTYRGDTASIPIRLTSIAAAPDLRLEVSVFGATRAVPESYLHVTINEANLDWWGGGSNYYDVVARAADQAGGHAFATDYAGPTSDLEGTLWTPDAESLAQQLDVTDSQAFAAGWNTLALGADANVRFALGLHLDEVHVDGLLDPADLENVDLTALKADLEGYVFEPLRRAEALFSAPWVTRLSSSLDADEMTVDPTFVLNPDIEQDVSREHRAMLITECSGGSPAVSPRRLVLSDGRAYPVPSQSSVSDPSAWWTSNVTDVEALLVERTGKTGLAEIVTDNRDASWSEVGARQGCGCSLGGTSLTGSLLALLGVALVRRRAVTGPHRPVRAP